MTVKNPQVFTELISYKYQSLDEPDYSFAKKAFSSRPYAALIQELDKLYAVEEITDSNDDVSFRYVISKSNNQWVIELSMLGRYAVVLQAHSDGYTEIVCPNTSVPVEKDIISWLLMNQFEILTKNELEQPVALALSNAEPENVCIYQALFSDTDVLPWRNQNKINAKSMGLDSIDND